MKGYVFDEKGKEYALPQFLSWELCHGFSSPCDSFQLSFAYTPHMAEALESACRFTAEKDGQRVFRGVVDELEIRLGRDGFTACLRGRGMQALMLDNEAEAADYYGADAEFIAARHVAPFGIETDGFPAGGGVNMSVSGGDSHWSVFARFAEFGLGLSPRFSPDGRLLPDGKKGGKSLCIDGKTAAVELGYIRDRYGVITKATVKNRVTGSSTVVANPDTEGFGMRAERIINVPRKTGYDAMRHTGEYQIRKSMETFQRIKLTMPEIFAAFPGDRVSLTEEKLGIGGSFMVWASRSWADGEGCGTELELRKES